MKYTIHFLPEVEEDALNAYYWYEQKSRGLGDDFLRVFYTSAAEITRNPDIGRKVFRKFRRILTKRFPYSLYYLVEGNNIIGYGLIHTARNPAYIQDALGDR